MAPKNYNLDDIFRKKLDAESADDKISWEEMNDLLEKEEKKKKRRFIWFFSILTGLILSAGLYFTFKKDTKSNSVSSIEKTKSFEKPVTTDAKVNISTADIKEEKQDKAVTDSFNKLNHHNQNSVNQKSAGPITSLTYGQESKTNNYKNVTGRSKPENVSTYSAYAVDKANQNTEFPGSENFKTNDSLEDKTGDFLNKLSEEEQTPDSVNNISPEVNSVDSLKAKPNSGQAFQVRDSVLSDSAKENILKQRQRPWSAYVTAGVGYYFTAESVSPKVGAAVEKKFNEKISMNFSIYYSEIGGLYLKDSSEIISYFLDKNVSKESVVIEKVNVLNVPVSIQFHASPKNSFMLGVNFYYLLDSRSSYVFSDESQSESIKNDDNAKGYMDGLRQFNFAIEGGYMFSFSQKINAGIIYQRSITNPIDEDYFGETKKYFNSSLSILIYYKFY
jgi:hypothetical protein